MFKKSILIILVVVLISTAFLLYKNRKKSDSDKKEVVFWTLQLATFDKYVNNIISEFEAQNPNIKIKWVDIPYSEGEKRTLASILTDNPPDLVNLNPDFSFLLAQKGALRLFNEQETSSYNPSLMQVLSYKGKYFGLPFYATSSITLYNKDLLKKTGITALPKTYDELYVHAKTVKQLTGGFVTMPTLSENDTTLKILNKYSIDSPEKLIGKKSLDIFQQYQNLYKNDLIPKESITQTHREVLEKYMSGEILFLQAGSNFINLIKENAPSVYKSTDLTYQITGDTLKYDFSLMNLIIPIKSKNQGEALKFALFLTNDKNQLAFSKLTNVLPVNKKSLNDPYFTAYEENDLNSKARFISSRQLQNVQKPILYTKNQKEIITLINNAMQEILMNKEPIKTILERTSANWKFLGL